MFSKFNFNDFVKNASNSGQLVRGEKNLINSSDFPLILSLRTYDKAKNRKNW